jgi:uncharacterized protein
MPPETAELARILREARRIAVVGLSRKPARASYQVSAFMQRAGYTIVPVHPAGGVTLGEPVHADLAAAAAAGPIDIVNVFRRSETIPELVDACLAIRPKLVWLQVGVVHEASARRLEAGGIPVVMDRCLAVEYSALGV